MTSKQFERIKEVIRDAHIEGKTLKSVVRDLKYRWSLRTVQRVVHARSLKAYGLACRHVSRTNY